MEWLHVDGVECKWIGMDRLGSTGIHMATICTGVVWIAMDCHGPKIAVNCYDYDRLGWTCTEGS